MIFAANHSKQLAKSKLLAPVVQRTRAVLQVTQPHFAFVVWPLHSWSRCHVLVPSEVALTVYN